MRPIALGVLLTLLALALPSALVQPALAHELTLQQVWRQSDAVALAQVPDVPTDLVPLPIPGERPFQRQIRHFRVEQVLRGQLPPQIDVDEAGWRAEYAALRRCGKRDHCQVLKPDRLLTTLGHEPRPGEHVLVFVRRVHGGLELTAALAIDRASRASELPTPRGRR